jgi:hypothetical protein
MAEVLLSISTPVHDDEGHAYIARVCGRQEEDGRWEGWIEFVPGDGGPVLRTARETKQPKRSAVEYWATGLSSTYLEGALQRALHPEPPDVRPPRVAELPSYDGPAETAGAPQAEALSPHAVLDPSSVFAQGEAVLRQQLGALGTDHLRTMVRAHDLGGSDPVDLQGMQHAALVELIVSAVRKRAG